MPQGPAPWGLLSRRRKLCGLPTAQSQASRRSPSSRRGFAMASGIVKSVAAGTNRRSDRCVVGRLQAARLRARNWRHLKTTVTTG